ncbi:M23 family metallopeptidase [Tahibacter amnicola]|uniref:M23 family metallopeptidase n=1 Tax=Tahibacter amnicola TaxID=2976241 RepID=A0ABY6BEM3_9GAMM|nr:M23 family metallopeptidase [Tahibacter amnicola]MCU7376341.1 M23 family metallopeptidase [Paucibacter sp. O1-1]MDA3831358.1 M23 family metallopeptidase [Paucibacter sp. O1-1]UXI67708.1 M23 family metallopeptidase [Tahibacter amnicola]
MNIIIVAKPHAVPKSIDLGCWRTRIKCAAALGTAAIACALLGVSVAYTIAGPKSRALAEVQDLRDATATQLKELEQVKIKTQRDLDALAVKLGELQAHATRLNALGERLTRAGKLDDGEFNFAEAPSVGGPEENLPIGHASAPALEGSIDELRDRFSRQQAQLEVLENLLLDRKVESDLLPSGMPVESGYISSYFGGRPDPFSGASAFHSGIDFDAAAGADIHSVAEGVVSWSGQRPGYGNVVEVDHGNGYMTRYAHNSRNIAAVGQRVRVGDVIAKVGSTGRSTGSHVHFEVWLNGRAVNPIAYVRSQRKG